MSEPTSYVPGAATHSLVVHADDQVSQRVWSVVYVTRQIGLAAGALVIAALPQFGGDRWMVAAIVGGGALPYDIWLHVHQRRYGRIHGSAVVVHGVLPPLVVLLFPAVWFPAVVAALANLGLFTVTYTIRVSAPAAGAGGLALLGAGLAGDVENLAAGMAAYVIAAPPLVVSVTSIFEALTTAEVRYRDLLEYANDMIYTHDVETLRFLSINEAVTRVLGYTKDDLGDITVADIVAPEFVEKAAEMTMRKLEGEAEATTWDLEIVAKDGRRVPVEVSTRIIYRRGEPVAVQGIARDITERWLVEQQRAALDEAKTEFIANAAHELRTPLTTLAGLASVLASTRGKMSEEELQDALEALDRQGRRARALADKLLDLSAVELGQINVASEPVHVREAVERALEDAPPPEGTSVNIHVDSKLQAVSDSLRLGEVLHNLLTNAYRYGGDHITVEGLSVNGRVVLSVTDDGPGVPDDLVPHLFEPFTRGDHTARPDSTGLGLAIAARLVEALGGEIVYEPGQPRGACFRVSFPTTA